MSVATIATVPGVRPLVELGVGDVFDPQGDGLWQADPPSGPYVSQWQPDVGAVELHNTWFGQEPTWLDVTCHAMDITTFIGRDHAEAVWEIGTATVIFENGSGWADYPPTIEPEHPLLTVRPGRQIRISIAVDDGPAQVLWRGYIDAANPAYDAEVGAVVTLDCVDAKGEAGRAYAALQPAPVGAGETADARINRVLTAVDWPTYRRDIDPTGVTLVATDLDADAVDLLNLAADSAGGAVFGDLEGAVAFRARDWQTFDPGDPLDGRIDNLGPAVDIVMPVEDPAGSGLYDPAPYVFDEDPDGTGLYALVDPTVELWPDPDAAGLYAIDVDLSPWACPQSWEITFAREDLSTRVIVGRDGEAQVIRNDIEGQAMFGIETFERVDLETSSDTTLGDLADRVLAVRSHEWMPRIGAVTLDAATSRGVVDVLLNSSPYVPARIGCGLQLDGRQVFARTMMVVGVEHAINPETWSARIALDDAGPFMTTFERALWQPDGADPGTAWWQGTTLTDPPSTWARFI